MYYNDIEDEEDLYGRVSITIPEEDNLHFKGPFYVWTGEAPDKAWPISIAWTREIEPPWRNGIGLLIRRNEQDLAFGFVYKRQDPRERKLGFTARRRINNQRTATDDAGVVLSRRKSGR